MCPIFSDVPTKFSDVPSKFFDVPSKFSDVPTDFSKVPINSPKSVWEEDPAVPTKCAHYVFQLN